MQSTALIFGIIVGAALAIYSLFSILASDNHLRDCLADPKFNLAEEYIISYRMVRFILLFIAAALIFYSIKNL